MAGEALFVRICLDLLEFAAIYWNLLEFAGICWNLLGFAGICWDLLEFAGIYWHLPAEGLATGAWLTKHYLPEFAHHSFGHQTMADEALFGHQTMAGEALFARIYLNLLATALATKPWLTKHYLATKP